MFGLGSDPGTNAVELLKQDHDEVEKLFDQYEDAKEEHNEELKAQIVAALCRTLTVHARIEEEIFYPAMRRHEEDAGELVDEAAVEHQTLKNLIGELVAAAPNDDLYDAKVKVLGEYVKHHVKEEEGEMFPLARKADIDLDALGAKLLQRKGELADDARPPAARRSTRAATKGTAATNGRRPAAKTTTRKSTASSRRH
jgi:hemerythrin superfamily protein